MPPMINRIKGFDGGISPPGFDELLNYIANMVLKAADIAYSYDSLNKSISKFNQWAETAKQYLDSSNIAPNTAFLYAHYGYAVEELVNIELKARPRYLIYEIQLQVTHGHTRPDIVILVGSEEIAWLDITSKKSAGHIYSKLGAGWRIRPYVAELLYPELDLGKLKYGSHHDTILQRQLLERDRAIAEYQERLNRYFVEKFEVALQEFGREPEKTQASFARIVKRHFMADFKTHKMHTTIKGMLRLYSNQCILGCSRYANEIYYLFKLYASESESTAEAKAYIDRASVSGDA